MKKLCSIFIFTGITLAMQRCHCDEVLEWQVIDQRTTEEVRFCEEIISNRR